MSKTAIVIGSGFAGLAAATSLADKGYQVKLLEKNSVAGGRARQFKEDGFVFDMGPSWYWMPDVFDDYFALFGKKTSDYYALKRLSPSYQIIFGEDDIMEIPSSMADLEALFEKQEPGSAKHLRTFLKEAAYKYEVGMTEMVHKPSLSILEFVDWKIAKGALKLHMFTSFSKYIRKFFSDSKLLQLLEFPVLFLGAKPENTPALYSIMNYADMALGTWYPMGGMHTIVEGMVSLAKEKGVEIHLNSEVSEILVSNGKAQGVTVNGMTMEADIVVAGADYHHVDQHLLQPAYRNYSEEYWDKRVMSPSSLLFYVGLDKKLEGIDHHNLFFDTSFTRHAEEIYDDPKWPEKPLFYVCAPSVTDPSVAPEGKENLFILIPLAPDLKEEEGARERYFDLIMDRMETLLKQPVKQHVIYNRSYAHQEFKDDYHAFKGNAYGLANTLKQTAFLKPRLKNKHLNNLYYTGQLSTPGPGVPPSLISGQVVAKLISQEHPVGNPTQEAALA